MIRALKPVRFPRFARGGRRQPCLESPPRVRTSSAVKDRTRGFRGLASGVWCDNGVKTGLDLTAHIIQTSSQFGASGVPALFSFREL
ncbi:hypothetical protein EVAR_40681_1 [Eumeta japonica]|uniref:Uncharacterized protein n=1 Tax=Eumeta variegata TaxID=151549 RepID=A0A4C1X660_EUMVA|nr:hypothetical protein EVAR_40681_1 [Eumeta japonica]